MPKMGNCVTCGKRLQLHSRTSRANPCCHECRRRMSKAEKYSLGIINRGKGNKRAARRCAVKFPNCAHCGELFTLPGKSERRYCSDGCLVASRVSRANPRQNQKNMARKRARRKAAFVEDVDPLALFERDGWRCHLCGRKCPRDARVPHPLAPTIDHIVPLAGGGEHSYRNTATAHFRCNVSKGARDVGQQLALVG